MSRQQNIDLVTDEIIFKYIMGISQEELKRQLNVSSRVINKVLNKNKIPRHTRSSLNVLRFGYSIDPTKFSSLSTEEDFYFLGYIVADGNISNGRLAITLAQKDGYILRRLQTYLGMPSDYGYRESEITDKRTGKTYPRATFAVKNAQITDSLSELGIVARKSTFEKLPSIQCKFNRHFWRGVVDGDGYVKLSKTRASALVLVGSLEIIESFIEFCETTVGLKTPRVPTSNTYTNTILYKVQLTGDDARNVAKHLYSNTGLCLIRKQNQLRNIGEQC